MFYIPYLYLNFVSRKYLAIKTKGKLCGYLLELLEPEKWTLEELRVYCNTLLYS